MVFVSNATRDGAVTLLLDQIMPKPLLLKTRGGTRVEGQRVVVASRGGNLRLEENLVRINCNHCGEEGHIKKLCYAFKREQKREQKANNNQKKDDMIKTIITFD